MKQDRDYLAGHIAIWIAQVAASRNALVHFESHLDSRDRARVSRFRFPEDRARFFLGRVLLRKCLGLYLDQPPENIQLAYTDRGRPILPRDEAVQFSISHTGDRVALALTVNARVGVDLEQVRSHFDPLELAHRVFSAEELQRFQTLSPAEKKIAFFRVWTRKEAYLKARGEGISEALQQISVSLGREDPAFVKDSRDPATEQIWRLYPLPLPADYSGSIACDDVEKRPECTLAHLDVSGMVQDS